MKDKKDNNIKAVVSKTTIESKTYYNIVVEVDGFLFEVAPKFLNNKQKALLRHKLARALGDENAK